MSRASHHRSGVFPFGQFVEDPQQVNTGKQIPPAKLIVVSCFLLTEKIYTQLLLSSISVVKAKSIKWQKWANVPNFLQSTQGVHAPRSEGSRVLRCCWGKRNWEQWNNGNLSKVYNLSCKWKSYSLKRCWKVPIFSCDIRHDVLVEELENERDAVGKHQMLSHILKLWKQAHKQIWLILTRMRGRLQHNFNIWENI